MLTMLLFLLAAAVICDVKTRKIPNALITIGILAGLISQIVLPIENEAIHASGSAIGVKPALWGIAVGFATMLPLYALRAMGAGDVKLMMMVGAFLGPLQTFGAVMLTFAAGGILALVMVLWQRSFKQLALNLRFMLTTSAVNAVTGQSVKFDPLQQTAGRMPYAVAIAAGTLLQLYLVRSGGWALS